MKKPAIYVVTCARCGKRHIGHGTQSDLPDGWLYASDGKFCPKCKTWRSKQ